MVSKPLIHPCPHFHATTHTFNYYAQAQFGGEDAFFGLGEADAPAGGGGGGFDLDRDDLSAGGGGNDAFDMSAMGQGMPSMGGMGGMGGMPGMGQMPPGMKMVRVFTLSTVYPFPSLDLEVFVIVTPF